MDFLFFFKLNRSLLAVSPFLSGFQAPVWSGKSIIVVKWALSKHPCGGTTPVCAPAKVWGWLWAPAAPFLQSGCAYTHSRWYLIIRSYMGTRVYRTLWCTFSPGCGFMGIHPLSRTTAQKSELSIFYLINAAFTSPVWIHSSQDRISLTKTGCISCSSEIKNSFQQNLWS